MVVLVLVLGSATARADGGPFGLGIILGSPTGIDGKLRLSPRNAIDFGVGAAFANERGLHVHVDYLFQPAYLTQTESFNLPLYVGLGGRVLVHESKDGDDVHLGFRFPVGIAFEFRRIPIDVFIEIAVIFDVIQHNSDIIDLNAGAGLRYYF